MVEAVATLLNTVFSRVLFSHFVMFLVFLFIGFAFKPAELDLYLLSKTPPFFPDWFTLSSFGSLIFAFVSTMCWILLCRGVKAIWLAHSEKKLQKERDEKWKSVYNSLSEKELAIVMRLFPRGMAPLKLPDSKERTQLVAKGIIFVKQFNPVLELYILTPAFSSFMAKQIRERG